jgi:ParB family transcriptional regulator, chromosome partitioning protein
VVATTPYLFDDYRGKRVAHELLGLADTETPELAVSKLPATGDGWALVILLGMVLGMMEAKNVDCHPAWRTSTPPPAGFCRILMNMAAAIFSSSWRILEPYGSARRIRLN